MKCPACGKGELSKKVKSQMFTYKGSSILLEQPGLWCNRCDDGILSSEDMEVTEKKFEDFKSSKVDNLL